MGKDSFTPLTIPKEIPAPMEQPKKAEVRKDYSCAWLITGEGEYTNHYSRVGKLLYLPTPEGTQWRLIKIHCESSVVISTLELGEIVSGRDLENVVYQGQENLVITADKPIFIYAIRESFRPVKEGRF